MEEKSDLLCDSKSIAKIVSNDKPIDTKKIKEPINFMPYTKIIFSAHPLPEIKGANNGK